MKKVNKKSQIKTKYDIAFIVMAVVASLVILGTGTYAYYQSTIAGKANGTIAKWSFKANNQTSTFNLDFGALYPGKSDVKYLELSAEDSDLPVLFEFIFQFPKIGDTFGDISDHDEYRKYLAAVGNLFFDSEHTFGPALNTPGYFGILAPGEKISIPLYYYWDYENYDWDDIQLGDAEIKELAAQNKIVIMGRQLDISSEENLEASMVELLGLADSSTCAMGEYSYSNRYGYPCESPVKMEFTVGNQEVAGDSIQYELGDGSVIELPKYILQPINFIVE